MEVFQNCVIFNNKTFDTVTSRDVKEDQVLSLEEGKPLIFGANRDKGIRLNGLDPEVVTLGDGIGQDDLLVHQPKKFKFRLCQYFSTNDLSRISHSCWRFKAVGWS